MKDQKYMMEHKLLVLAYTELLVELLDQNQLVYLVLLEYLNHLMSVLN